MGVKKASHSVKLRVFLRLLLMLALVFFGVFFALNLFLNRYIQGNVQAQLEDLNLVKGEWNNLLRELGGPIRSSLRETVLEPSGDDGLCIVFTDANSHAIGSRQSTLEEIEKFLAGKYGKEIKLKTRLVDTGQTVNTVYVTEEDLKSIHMDVTIED